jgi:hypothetical protein
VDLSARERIVRCLLNAVRGLWSIPRYPTAKLVQARKYLLSAADLLDPQ